jgi:hypothetical protein
MRRLEDGHDRAARREQEWCWDSVRNKDIEKIRVEDPLS